MKMVLLSSTVYQLKMFLLDMLCHNRELFTARVDALSKVDTGGDTDTDISVEMTMTCFLSSSNVLSSSQKNQWTKVDDDCVCIG